MAKLFAAEPPVVDAPIAEPTEGTGRWVPVQYTVGTDAKDQPKLVRGGQEQKDDTFERRESAPPQPSAHVGDAVVHYVWRGLGSLAAALVPVAQQVPYLGRPTTPAIVTVASVEPQVHGVAPGRLRLVPDRGAALHLNVPSTRYLASLDAVHKSRVANRTIGFEQPIRTQRTQAAYRTVQPPAPVGIGRASRVEAFGWVKGQLLYRVAGGGVVLAGDIQFCTAAVADVLQATEVIPVLWGVGGEPDGRLKAVLVCDATAEVLPEAIQVATRTGDVRLTSCPAEEVPQSSLECWTAGALLGRSPLWTTLVPVNLGVDETLTLHAAQPGLESATGEAVVGFGTHSEPRGAWQPYFPERMSSGYISVQFAESVHGPLFVQVGEARVPLIPAHPGAHDDDPRRGTLL